ncbi:MAG: hypothetical protein ACC645_04005 [Pirellulales bacterium]
MLAASHSRETMQYGEIIGLVRRTDAKLRRWPNPARFVTFSRWSLPWCLVFAVFQAFLGDQAGRAQATDPPQPILWHDTEFTIPFRVHVGPSETVAPAEIWLYVSTDHGVSWSHVATDDPQAGRFVFRAAGDGEYWFSLRTLDRFGTVLPTGPHRAELRVTVDTEMPLLEVDGAKGVAGEVQVHWRATDKHLDPDTLTIEYRYDTDPYWQPLATGQTTPDGAERRSRSGQAAWYPVPGCRSVAVRAKVQDRAGNRATRQVRIDLSETDQENLAAAVSQMVSARKAKPSPVEEGRPSAAEHSTDDPYAWTADRSSDVPLDRWLAGSVESLLPSSPTASIAEAASTPPIPVTAAGETRRWVPTGPPGKQPSGDWSPARHPPGAGSTTTVGRPDRSPPVAQVADPTRRRGMGPQLDGATLKVVRSDTFEIDYSLPPAGRDETDRLVPWATTDLGKSWRPVEATEVGENSLRVSVGHQGLYGFRLVSVRADGRGEPAPVPGDRPDVWVHVDWTPPLARIVSVDSLVDGSPSTLQIRWEASDRRLASRPVALYYRWDSEQAWAPIVVNLENTGQFVWQTGLERIGPVDVRLDVRDFAGNVTTVQVAREAGEQTPPGGRIFRTGPIDRSAQRAVPPSR